MPAKTRTKPVDARTLRQVTKALLGQREALLLQVELEAAEDYVSDLGSEEDPAELGTATFDRERHLSLSNNVHSLLAQNAKALQRIDEGSYGLCESCGRPIPPERLKALPHALKCFECKNAEERR